MDRFTKPFTRFRRIEATAGAVLLLCALLALVLSNSSWSMSFLVVWDMQAGFRLGGFESSRSLSNLLNAANLGILGASGASAACGLLALAWLTSPATR